jgi:hypothetical protein
MQSSIDMKSVIGSSSSCSGSGNLDSDSHSLLQDLPKDLMNLQSQMKGSQHGKHVSPRAWNFFKKVEKSASNAQKIQG